VELNYNFSDLSALFTAETPILKFGTPSLGSAVVVCIGLAFSFLFILSAMVLAELQSSLNGYWMLVVIVLGLLAAGLRRFLFSVYLACE
jgi:hypothetical protein